MHSYSFRMLTCILYYEVGFFRVYRGRVVFSSSLMRFCFTSYSYAMSIFCNANDPRWYICVGHRIFLLHYLRLRLHLIIIISFRQQNVWYFFSICSKFGDIYNEEFFIKTLENDVRVVQTVPGYIMERFDYNLTNVYNFRIKAWSSIKYYSDTVLPKLLEERSVFQVLYPII